MKAYYLRPSNEEFEDTYAQAGLQPSTGSRGLIKHTQVEYAKGVAATSLRAGGAGMQRGGKAINTAGKTVTKAGLAMSRSGIGALAGAPLMAAGATMRVAGTATQAAGTVAGQSGRALRNAKRGQPALSLKNTPALVKDIKSIAKTSRTSIMIFAWATPLWFMLQLPLALLGLIAFGAIDAAASILPNWLVLWAAGNMAELLLLSVFFIGMGTLIAMAIIYTLSGIQCLFGNGAHLKGPLFCLAVVFYLLPFTNIFPWFIPWALAVWRYPK